MNPKTAVKAARIVLTRAGPGYVIGHEDIISMRNFSTSMVCKSDVGTVYALKAAEVLKTFQKDESSAKTLIQSSQLRDMNATQNIRAALQAQ